MMLQKRGSMYFSLVSMVLALVGLVIVGGLIKHAYADTDDIQAEITCHDSIGLRAVTTLQTKLGFVESDTTLTPQLCRTIDVKIDGDHERVMKQMADKVARCWWMFHEGKYEEILAKQEKAGSKETGVATLGRIYGMPEIANSCFNCYIMLIEELDGAAISSSEFAEYLRKTPYPKVKGKTYLEYIQSQGGPGRIIFDLDKIEEKQAYGISFVMVNKLDPSIIDYGKKFLSEHIFAVVLRGEEVELVDFTTLGMLEFFDRGFASLSAYLNGERDVSSIYVSNYAVAQGICGTKDIAGR